MGLQFFKCSRFCSSLWSAIWFRVFERLINILCGAHNWTVDSKFANNVPGQSIKFNCKAIGSWRLSLLKLLSAFAHSSRVSSPSQLSDASLWSHVRSSESKKEVSLGLGLLDSWISLENFASTSRMSLEFVIVVLFYFFKEGMCFSCGFVYWGCKNICSSSLWIHTNKLFYKWPFFESWWQLFLQVCFSTWSNSTLVVSLSRNVTGPARSWI